jgi:cupin 2 domain-containing protein
MPRPPEPLRRGRLRPGGAAPKAGESSEPLAGPGEVVVEQILSSSSPDPCLYDQPADEWVLVLEGGATLDVAGEAVTLAAGDWLLLPAGTAHRVLGTEQGTSWLAVHPPPTGDEPTIRPPDRPDSPGRRPPPPAGT